MMWLALSNKLLTWEMLNSPGICFMCKMNEEMNLQLFTLHPNVGSVWIIVTQNLTNNGAHDSSNATLEHCTQLWW